MRKFKLLTILTSMTILLSLLTACTSSSASPHGMKVINVDELETFFDEEETGFLVVSDIGDSTDPEEILYLKALEEELIKLELSALRFDVYLSNGKDEQSKFVNPASDYTNVETLHFVKKGQVMGTFDLTRYEGTKLQEELAYFTSLMKKHL